MALAAQAAEGKISKFLDALATKTDVDQMRAEVKKKILQKHQDQKVGRSTVQHDGNKNSQV